MTIFAIDITDPRHLRGLTAARGAHNAALPDVLDAAGKVIVPNPNAMATDKDYWEARVIDLLESYAKQHVDDPVREAFLSKLSPAKRAEVEMVLAVK